MEVYTMTQKLYLEIAFKDNDWAEAINNVFSSIKSALQQFRGAFYWSEELSKKDFDAVTDLIRSIIAAQLNFENFFRDRDAEYDYTEDVASIKFDIVTEDRIKSWDNYETAYIQLFGSKQDYGNWFIV
jgi:hypothetical protein